MIPTDWDKAQRILTVQELYGVMIIRSPGRGLKVPVKNACLDLAF